jgi:hypothetical protein
LVWIFFFAEDGAQYKVIISILQNEKKNMASVNSKNQMIVDDASVSVSVMTGSENTI